MIKICEICEQKFESNSKSRLYCFECSGESTRMNLEFHHKNPKEKDFKIGSGNTMSWRDYKKEALKCILVCSNCHKEIHSELGYIYNFNTIEII